MPGRALKDLLSLEKGLMGPTGNGWKGLKGPTGNGWKGLKGPTEND